MTPFGQRKRLAFLLGVNGLILLHIIAYYRFGQRSIGCVDFNGIATVLSHGTVGAGTFFIVGIIGGTLALGRVFCGWGCHFALFQDLLTQLLARLGVTIPFRRSRLELVLPPVLFFFTLCLPLAAWIWRHSLPAGVSVDLGYPEVWRLMPGIKGILLILVFDVIVLTLLFGSRGFCRYLCPYGFLLRWFQAASPFRVIRVGACDDCGVCSKVCPTGVSLKHELDSFGVVRDLGCVNCGDCVAACPAGALAIRPTRKAYARGYRTTTESIRQPAWAEVTLLFTSVSGLLLYRGKEYGDFLAAAMGLTAGALIVAAIHPSRFLSARCLRVTGRRPVRLCAASLAGLILAGLVMQGVGQISLHKGRKLFEAGRYTAMYQTYERGDVVATRFRAFTLLQDTFASRLAREIEPVFLRANDLIEKGAWADAAVCYRVVLIAEPDRVQAWGNLGTCLFMHDEFNEAARCYLRVLDSDPSNLVALYHLAMTRIHQREVGDAVELVEKILSIDHVGNCYKLIRQNPEFKPLDSVQRYRQAMTAYALVHQGQD